MVSTVDHTMTAPEPHPDSATRLRLVVELTDREATDTTLVGAKAANLAQCLSGGLPVLPGFVITTAGTKHYTRRVLGDLDDPLYRAWERLSRNGAQPLVVRSSSVAEDSENSSMAGRFESILHVVGWEPFVDAVEMVVASSAAAGLADAPMAVLVQPMSEARVGGVLFGLDPLTGDRKQLLVSAAAGLPDQIVSGATTGTTIMLSRRGRRRSKHDPIKIPIRPRELKALARVAARTEKLFGEPQDMEWLIEPKGTLRLLQSRPITAAAAIPEPGSHVLGPGPVAETFPDALSRLEQDLWQRPLEQGVRDALRLSGGVGKKVLEGPLVYNVDGYVVVDLDIFGVHQAEKRWWTWMDPRPGWRAVRAAWRVGRLRVALPKIVEDLVTEIDGQLADVPDVEQLDDRRLLTVLDNSELALASLHAHEVLAGFFLDADATATTGASLALATVARARLDGLSDEEILAQYPVAMALLPARIGGPRALPKTPDNAQMPTGKGDDPTLLAREAARLRARWVQELMARCALQLGHLLAVRGQLHHPEDVRGLDRKRLGELVDAIDVAAFVYADDEAMPLPAAFRLTADGTVVPDMSPSAGGVQGVSPGRVSGVVTHDRSAAAGKILVVRSLDPDLALVLPDLAALVAATGSPLSHLAILAREYKVPAVVGYDEYLSDDAEIIVDGGAGTVEVGS